MYSWYLNSSVFMTNNLREGEGVTGNKHLFNNLCNYSISDLCISARNMMKYQKKYKYGCAKNFFISWGRNSIFMTFGDMACLKLYSHNVWWIRFYDYIHIAKRRIMTVKQEGKLWNSRGYVEQNVAKWMISHIKGKSWIHRPFTFYFA